MIPTLLNEQRNFFCISIVATNSLIEKLNGLKDRFGEVSILITDPNVISDQKRYMKLTKEYHDLEAILKAGKNYSNTLQDKDDALQILNNEQDNDLREMAKTQLDEDQKRIPELEEEIKLLMLPSNPEDEKNAIMEIRGGTGGDEAALFAGDLFRMYSKYCERKGWKIEITRYTEGPSGGYKEIIFTVKGENAYGTLKYEGGVHRVQRVPTTETQGRVHTSAATVAVLPEVGTFDIDIKEEDVRTDIFCAHGHGGQGVNTTYSAIRLVHIPTGIMVQCQDERSQLRNKEKAMIELRSRVYNMEHEKYLEGITSKRKTMVSTGDRSAKIRTYNYPQGRITDHRISYTIYNLSAFMEGDIQDCIDHLIVAENAERLKENKL